MQPKQGIRSNEIIIKIKIYKNYIKSEMIISKIGIYTKIEVNEYM